MLYRPYERRFFHGRLLFTPDFCDILTEFCRDSGVFLGAYDRVYEVLNVNQFVLNFRGKVMYIVLACCEDGEIDYMTTTNGKIWEVANIWYQASGKPQATFEETRQKMIDEFMANR